MEYHQEFDKNNPINKRNYFIFTCLIFPLILFFLSLFIFFGYLALNSDIAHCEHIRGYNVTFIHPTLNNTRYECIYTNKTSGYQFGKSYDRDKDVPWNQQYVRNVINIVIIICIVPCCCLLIVGFYFLILFLLLQFKISPGASALLAIPLALLFPIFPILATAAIMAILSYFIIGSFIHLILNHFDKQEFDPDKIMYARDDISLFEDKDKSNKLFNFDNEEKVKILHTLTILLCCLVGICFACMLLSYTQILDNDALCCRHIKGMKVEFDVIDGGKYECIYTNKTSPNQTFTFTYDHRGDIPWNIHYLRRYVDITLLVTVIPACVISCCIIFLTVWIMKIVYETTWINAAWLLLKYSSIILGLLIAGIIASIIGIPISLTLGSIALIIFGPPLFVLGIFYTIYLLYAKIQDDNNRKTMQDNYHSL